MEFKSNAIPGASKGIRIKGKSQVVPNQSLSLKEILERFTRNEPLPVGHDVSSDEDGDEDLEKLKHADLVDKFEYIDKLKAVQKEHQEKEDKKAKTAKEKAQKAYEAKIRADVEAQIKSEQGKGNA